MTSCTCSTSYLHAQCALSCCTPQVRPSRGVTPPDGLGGSSDSALLTLRTVSQFKTIDSRVNLIQNFSLSSEASSRLCRGPGMRRGVGLGLKDYSKTVARRKSVSEVQYRVQDAVDSGAGTENGADNSGRRTRDRNRKHRNGERRRRVQILSTNGMVDLEEHLGLITDQEIISRQESTSTSIAINSDGTTSDEEGRRFLESSLLSSGVSEMEGMQESFLSAVSETDFPSRVEQAHELEKSSLYPSNTQTVGSADFSEDEQTCSFDSGSESNEVDVQNGSSKGGMEGLRSLAELPGGRRVVELVAAWDHLAVRLPPEFSRSSSSDLLLKALKITVMALQHTSRDESGRTPLCRALAVSQTLVELGMDVEVISAAFLREAVDTGLVTYDFIEKNLGASLALLLHDCSRVRYVPPRVETLDDGSAKALREFCLSFHDIRAIVVQLACQLDTMQHIHYLPRYQQQILALGTMQIYAPLAHAIGIGSVALELEDLGFGVLFPDSYAYVENWLKGHWEDGNQVVNEFKQELSARLQDDPELQSLVQNVTVLGRYKSRFSTMKKLLKDGRKPEDIYDVLGLRVILEPKDNDDAAREKESGIRACYQAMEAATNMWQVVPGRLKDYIEKPKQNGYESLHLAVYVCKVEHRCPTMEIQIRTKEMDTAAVSGEASHSSYKGGMSDPEQIRSLRLIMLAAANVAASRFGDIAGDAVDVESGDHTYDSEDQMFKMFDKNHDGVISVQEFKEVITELGADEGDALALMQIVDLNTDGSVSVEEFSKFRQQVQISQNLAGVDKEFSSQLGSKLQGSNEVEAGKHCLGSGSLLKSETEDTTWNLENVSGSMGETRISSSLHPVDAHKEVYNKGILGSPRANEVASAKFDNTAVKGSVEKAIRDIAGQGSKVPDLASKPKPNLVKPVLAVGTVPSPRLQKNPQVLPELGDEMSNFPSSVKTGLLEEQEVAEDVVEQTLSQIRQLISANNLKDARDIVSALSNQYPHNTKVLLHYASLERKCGNLKVAGTLYSQAIDMFKFKRSQGVEYVRALQAWASLEAQLGNPRRARYLYIESIEASEKGDTDSILCAAGVYGLHGWARLEEKCGNWSKARDLLERAANLQPGNAVIHQSRASLEAKVHNYHAAHTHFRLAVKADPEDVRCWHAWAMFEASRGNENKMRKLFQEALRIDPENVHSLQAWAHNEGLLGTAESRMRARELYQKCIDINPDSVYCWQAWAILEQDSGNFEGARVLFEKCLDVDSESVPCLQAYAHMERKCGNLKVAQQLLIKAAVVEPENAAVLMELARIEDLSGNNEAALDLYRRAARVDKQKSAIKRRMFELRKKELQESGLLPKPKAPTNQKWRYKPVKSGETDKSPKKSESNIDQLKSRYERIHSVAVTGLNDR